MKKKKDILFLCQFFYPEYVSSATLPYDTALALKEAGFSVDALCGYPREYSDDKDVPMKETVNGIHIHRLKYLQLGRKGFLGRLVNYFSFTFMVFLHLFKLGKYKAVVVYSNPPILPWIASWAKVLFGTKLVFVAYDLYPEIAVRTNTLREGNVICRLMDHINQCVFRRADGVVALSSEMKEFIAGNRPIDASRIRVIPNWYEDKGAPDTDLRNNGFSAQLQGKFVVSCFGNLGTAQDADTVLDTIRILANDPDIFFLLAGHGNKMEYVQQTVEQEGISNVRLCGFLKGKDFQDALQISNCALIPLGRGVTGLGVPSKTYSYMMQGIPLLAIMDECDIVSDIESGAGHWVRNGESEKLAGYIRSMQADPRKVAAMSARCREVFLEKYTTPICTGEYVSFFRTLLGKE